METVQKQENKLRSDLREAAWKFEVVRSWTEEELQEQKQGVPGVPVTVNMYVSARVLSQFFTKEKDLQNLQKPPRWVKEKISLILKDIYKQGEKEEKDYSNAGRPSVLSYLRRKAARDWVAYCEFLENTKEDYLKGYIKKENLLFNDTSIDEEEIYDNVIYPFLKQITRKRRRDAEKGREEHRRQAQLFPHSTPPESSERNRKEDRNE